jgi:putative transcriptional regulator
VGVIENRLSEILGRKRMNVSELARGAGISRSAAHKLYHDTGVSFDRAVLAKVCGFLGVQVSDLLVYVPTDRQQDDNRQG